MKIEVELKKKDCVFYYWFDLGNRFPGFTFPLSKVRTLNSEKVKKNL